MVGSTYTVGDAFTTAGVPVVVGPFRRMDGTWNMGGIATVDNLGKAGGAGSEINAKNINLAFAFPGPASDVSFLFGEYGGYNNIMVNGQMLNFENYQDIDGISIDGVHVSVSGGFGEDNGVVKLQGVVNQFAVGGQEHFVDDVTFSRLLDMSFELTTCRGPIKWLQFPDMADGINISSMIDRPVVADDFLCTNGRPVTEVHFWGSFLDRDGGTHWAQQVAGPPFAGMPVPRVAEFKISFHRDIPEGVDADMPWSHPGELLKEIHVTEFEQHYWDSISHVDVSGRTWWEHKFYYIIKFNDEQQFRQRKGESYWLDIGAVMADTSENWHWGWETSKDHWNDAAVVGGGNVWRALEGKDMAFVLVTEDPTPYCQGDFDRDGDVDGIDLAVFAADCNRTDCTDTGDCEGDFDYDGDVDVDDLNVFAPDYGRQGCPCTMPVDCDDGNPCTEDFIDPVTMECVHAEKTCDDQNLCTEDQCNPDIGECMHDPVVCDDGDLCTIDRCDAESGCVFEPVNCDDQNVCTQDRCNPETGECLYKPIVCDDGDSCTLDRCDPVEGCIFVPRNCDDGDHCTEDMCDPDTGECINTLIDCDDGDPCTIDKCDPAVGCFYEQIPDCPLACCLPNDICADLPDYVCIDKGGQVMGLGTDCSNTRCPAPPTACCMPDGACLEIPLDKCEENGGQPMEPGAICSEIQCPVRIGACCLDGECVGLTPEQCEEGQGIFMGLGSRCAAGVCPQ